MNSLIHCYMPQAHRADGRNLIHIHTDIERFSLVLAVANSSTESIILYDSISRLSSKIIHSTKFLNIFEKRFLS